VCLLAREVLVPEDDVGGRAVASSMHSVSGRLHKVCCNTNNSFNRPFSESTLVSQCSQNGKFTSNHDNVKKILTVNICDHVSKRFSKAPHIKSHRAPRSCLPKKVSRQLSSEESVGSVCIVQLNQRRDP